MFNPIKSLFTLETVDKVKNSGLLLGCYGDLLAVDGIRNVSFKMEL